MKEEQFFDAIDSSLDTLELAEDRVRFSVFFYIISQLGLSDLFSIVINRELKLLRV